VGKKPLSPKKTGKAPKGAKSWSRLEAWDLCKLRYWFKYVKKVASASGLAAKFGSAFHDYRFRYYSHLRHQELDSDWEAAPKIAKSAFHDYDLPLDQWKEFRKLAETFAENRPLPGKMNFEVRFGVNENGVWSTFDKANYFRGIVDGLEVDGDRGVVTDAKTTMSMDLPFTQLRVYAAVLSLRYPEVEVWKLVFDFIRYNRTKSEEVLAANLEDIREHIRMKISRIESAHTYEPEPGEHCAHCPFLARCDYGKQIAKTIAIPKDEGDAKKMAEDFLFVQAQQAQRKRIIKTFVQAFGDVETPRVKAAFFPTEKKSADTRNLIRFLKKHGKDPVEYVAFPAGALAELMNDHQISDDIGNLITIVPGNKFQIKKPGKKDAEENDNE